MSFNFKDKNVKDMGKASGKAFLDGLGVGMSEDSYRAITAVEGIYVELESLTKNAAKNAERLAKKRQERQLDNLKNALELELICEQEYYEQLKVFRDENLRHGTDAWYKCTEEIAGYNQRLLDETRKQYEKIIALREELSEKLQGKEPWLKSTTTVFYGMGKNGSDLVYNDTELKNFREEIALLESYRDKLTELKNLGNVPQGIFTDISKMSVEDGLFALNTILSAEEKTRSEFFSGYIGHKLAADGVSAELSALLYGNETAADTSGTKGKVQTSFATILQQSFDEVPESYYALGADAGEAFGEGFMTKIPQIMEQVRSYFAEAICELGNQISATIRQSAQSAAAGTSNTYNTSYNFNSSKDTTTQQLQAARNAATLNRLRGGSE